RPAAGLGLPAALPARRDAGDAAHRHEDSSLHATIAAAAGEAPFGEAREHAKLLLGGPGGVRAEPEEDLARPDQRIRLIGDDLFRLFDDRWEEFNVRKALAEVSAVPVGG